MAGVSSLVMGTVAAEAKARPGAGRSKFVESLTEVVREWSVAPGMIQSVRCPGVVVGVLSLPGVIGKLGLLGALGMLGMAGVLGSTQKLAIKTLCCQGQW